MQIDKKSGFHSLCLYMNPVHTHTHTHTHTSLDIVFCLLGVSKFGFVSISGVSEFFFLFHFFFLLWIVGVL
jgi:hypothetical protein